MENENLFMKHLHEAKKIAMSFQRCREASLVLTKLDEARLWYDEFLILTKLDEAVKQNIEKEK